MVFSPLWRGRYPHMMPLDRVIWDRFLVERGDRFLGVQYDVMVGEGADAPAGMSTADRNLLLALTVKRVDALLITSDSLVLVEVKPRLGMAAVGQLVAYNLLWRRRYGDTKQVFMMWVGERSEPDLLFVMGKLGFISVVV
jgi:hypothetical protein